MDYQPVVIGAVTAVLSAVITYFSTRSKIMLDLTAEYDRELRRDRLKVYKALWKILKPLARYAREETLSSEVLKETSKHMRNWYFDTGGIYLSRETREPYFALRKAMHDIIDKTEPGKLEESDPLVKTLLRLGTELRASLADDIGTRRSPFVGYRDLG